MRFPILTIAASLLVPALLVGGCTADVSTTVTAPKTSAKAAAPCVTNPAKVIASTATEKSTTASLPAPLVSNLDAALKSAYKQAAAPGVIVGVRTPAGTWTHAYGYANPTTKKKMTTKMHMRIGSVTKPFTGTLILQLAEMGKLSLNDTIDKYYPGIPNGSSITLRQLTDMTSGISGYYTKSLLKQYFTRPHSTVTPTRLIADGVSLSPLFKPGAMFNYSNTNFILLGKVIQKVTGESYADVLHHQILRPLGLNNTSFPTVSPAIPSPFSQGYTLQGSGTPKHPANATHWNPSFDWTAGAMISTVSNLLRFDRDMVTGHGLLSTSAQTERLNSFPKPAGYGLAYGCIGGWVGHTGTLPGYNTTVYFDTTTDTSVVVMANSDISSGKCTESPTLEDNPTDILCEEPATRVFVAVSKALGHEFVPIPSK